MLTPILLSLLGFFISPLFMLTQDSSLKRVAMMACLVRREKEGGGSSGETVVMVKAGAIDV